MVYNMFNLIPAVWGAVAFTAAIVEMLQLRGNAFSFGLGALAAIGCFVAGLDLPIQIVVFLVVSVFSFLVLRPLFVNAAKANSKRHLEGMDKLVGKTGTVLRKVEGFSDRGIIDVEGRPCPAIPSDPAQKYNVGDAVQVTAFENGFLVVKKGKKTTE